jgi:hypothetical protein
VICACGTRLDAVTNITSDERPEPGDPTICAYCSRLLVFDEQLIRRPASKDDLRRLAGRPELPLLHDAARRFQELRAAKQIIK